MIRQLATIFLILCMGWQSLAFAGFVVLVVHEEQEQHELLHFQRVAHHHDEHAKDFHKDNSIASTAHVLCDIGQFSSALPSLQFSSLVLTGTDQPSVERLIPRVQFLSNGLYRPPKPSA
jgi:hypothetical protein